MFDHIDVSVTQLIVRVWQRREGRGSLRDREMAAPEARCKFELLAIISLAKFNFTFFFTFSYLMIAFAALQEIITFFCGTLEERSMGPSGKLRCSLEPNQPQPVNLKRFKLGSSFVFVNREEQCLDALRAFADFDLLRNSDP